MLDTSRIPSLQDLATRHWHNPDDPSPSASTPFDELVLAQHRANFDLWHEEDAARDPHASDNRIASVKRAIDQLNQRRNDLTEQIDQTLLAEAPPETPGAPLHSESPGLIIDRLSILALKIFHTSEETTRADATDTHKARNADRLTILLTQREDLAHCFHELWAAILSGGRRFKLYRQLKMYNDPTLNPVLYRHRETP